MLRQFDLVVGAAQPNEALIRAKLNMILISSIATERIVAGNIMSPGATTPESPGAYFAEPLRLQFEKHIQKIVVFGHETRLLQGFCDYSVWYADEKELGTNLIIYEAKKMGHASSGEAQCLAYMGMFEDITSSIC